MNSDGPYVPVCSQYSKLRPEVAKHSAANDTHTVHAAER